MLGVSMLPWQKNKDKSQAGISIKYRQPDESKAQNEDSPAAAMEAAAQNILSAIEQKDYKHLALALQNAFEIADSQPHEEGPHMNEEE